MPNVVAFVVSMRLISLEINNFRVIRNVSLSFPDRVIGIIGPNGAGKSSIIEAIAWALYGHQAARTGKDEIKSTFAANADNCEVTLEFSVNEEKYRVVRRLVGKKERAEVELYRGEASESVGVNETRAYVGQLLGLDWRGFLSSFLARQAELNALSDLQPSKRRDHIAGMLGIERLDKAIVRVKEDARFHQEKGKFLDTQLANKELVEARIQELTSNLGNLEAPLSKAAEELKKAETAFAANQLVFEKTQKTRDEWLRVKAGIEAEQKTVANLDQQLNDFRSEHRELTDSQSRVAQLAEKIKPLPGLKAELDRLKEIKGQLGLRDELADRRRQLEKQIEQATRQVKFHDNEIAEVQQKLKTIPDDVEKRLEEQQGKLATSREHYVHLKAELTTARNESGRIKAQLDSVAELGPESVCERCARPFGNDYDRIKEHLSTELVQFDAAVEKLAADLATAEAAGKEEAKLAEQLERQKNESYRLGVDLKAAEENRKKQSVQIEEYQHQLAQTARQLEKLEAVEFDQKRFDEVAIEVDELEKVSRELSQLEGSLKRLPVVEKAIADLTGKKSVIAKKLEELAGELAKMGDAEAGYETAVAAFNRSRDQVEELRKAHQDLGREKELAEREMALKMEQLQGFEKTAQELEQARSAHYYGEKLGQLFAEYRRDLIASIRPSLADLSSRLFSDMTDGKYSLVELDAKYNLRVMDSGTFYGVDRFSGGEKDLANLCMRLAISLALTESAGMQRSFVILDEVFGSQDNQRKELILKSMGKLKNRFPQILLITHIDDIKDGVEEIIEVLPTGNGWSEVKVNGEII